jgi:GGDEF domain-containing protein
VIGVTTVTVDITQRKQIEHRLRQLADHDPLTGIYNRRRLIQELDRQLRYAARSRRAGALLTLDLDHLKVVNDTYGHAAGDAVLTAVTAVAFSTLDKIYSVDGHRAYVGTVISCTSADARASLPSVLINGS